MEWRIYKSSDPPYIGTFFAHCYNDTTTGDIYLHKNGLHSRRNRQCDLEGYLSHIYRFNSIRDLIRKFKQFAPKGYKIVNIKDFRKLN